MTEASVTVASTLGAPPARRRRAPGRAHPGTEQHGPPSRRAPEGSSSTRRGTRSRSPGETWASSCQAARIIVTESPSGCIRPAHPATAGIPQGPSRRCREGIPGEPANDPGGGQVSGDAGTREAHRLSAGVRRSPANRDLTPLLFPLCRRVGTRGRTGSDAHHDRFRSRRTTTENRSRGTQARPGGHRGHAQPTPRGRRLRVAGGRWGAGGHPTVGTVFHVKHACAEPGAGRSDRASLGGAAGLLPRRTGSFPPRHPVLPRRAHPHAGWTRLARFSIAGFCIAGVPR